MTGAVGRPVARGMSWGRHSETGRAPGGSVDKRRFMNAVLPPNIRFFTAVDTCPLLLAQRDRFLKKKG